MKRRATLIGPTIRHNSSFRVRVLLGNLVHNNHEIKKVRECTAPTWCIPGKNENEREQRGMTGTPSLFSFFFIVRVYSSADLPGSSSFQIYEINCIPGILHTHRNGGNSENGRCCPTKYWSDFDHGFFFAHGEGCEHGKYCLFQVYTTVYIRAMDQQVLKSLLATCLQNGENPVRMGYVCCVFRCRKPPRTVNKKHKTRLFFFILAVLL